VNPAARYATTSLDKAGEGYGRWLGFLAWHGLLDPGAAPAERATADGVGAYVDELVALGNADHTVVGRLQELQIALRILAPGQDFGWVTRPGGVPVRQLLEMERRILPVHHSRKLYEWGMRMMERATTLSGAQRRRVALRDGLMIAILAARAPRLRSLAGMRLGRHLLREADGRWRLVLDESDIKTGRPLEYLLPDGLGPWVDRYVAVERAEWLRGRAMDAVWVNWRGEPLGIRGVEKRIRWWSAKEFGAAGNFGPHRFRHCLVTTGPAEDPEALDVTAPILGITPEVGRKHYDRGGAEAAAKRFHASLAAERRATETLARRLFHEQAGGAEQPPSCASHTSR
jgi:hypothetical protein